MGHEEQTRQFSGRQQKRREGYAQSIAHNIAHFVAGYQIGWDIDLLPRVGRGVLLYDLTANTVTSDEGPFESEMLGWARDLLVRNVEAMKMPKDWVKKATVTLVWTWLGEDFGLESTGFVETQDNTATRTVRNTQPPLPNRRRAVPYEHLGPPSEEHPLGTPPRRPGRNRSRAQHG